MISGALDTDYDIEILEMHHREKVDSPSGTALMLGEAAAKGRGLVFENIKDSNNKKAAVGRGRGSTEGEHRERALVDRKRVHT